MVDDRRKDGALATKARTIILQHYCGGEKNVENKSAAELPAQIIPSPAVESADAPTVCDFNHLKETTKNLDFEASRRMKRDESGDTSVHDNIGSRNAVKSQVFLLAILVVIYLRLDNKEQKEALKLAADIVFYDHGYKSICGVNKLRRTWSKRLKAAFVEGADNTLIRHGTRVVLRTPPSWRPGT